jgi:hypothetical protein
MATTRAVVDASRLKRKSDREITRAFLRVSGGFPSSPLEAPQGARAPLVAAQRRAQAAQLDAVALRRAAF